MAFAADASRSPSREGHVVHLIGSTSPTCCAQSATVPRHSRSCRVGAMRGGMAVDRINGTELHSGASLATSQFLPCALDAGSRRRPGTYVRAIANAHPKNWRKISAMCSLYSLAKGRDAIRQLANAMRDTTGNLPLLPATSPMLLPR